MISSPILAFPDYSLPFELHTDTSGQALGYILMQKYPDGTKRVIIYGGTELELLALVDGRMKYALYLKGKKFTVYTDHTNPQYLNNRLSTATRRALKLSSFKMKIVHKSGKENVGPDAISRLQPEVSLSEHSGR